MDICFYFLCTYIGVEVLNHVTTPCLPFWRTAKWFSKVALTSYISHQLCMRVPVNPYLCQHWSVFCILAILVGEKWCIIMVLICISSTTSNFELIICAYKAICISSLEKCLFKYLVHLKIKLFIFFFCCSKCSSCFLDVSPWLEMWLADILSHSVSCLFKFLIGSFKALKF